MVKMRTQAVGAVVPSSRVAALVPSSRAGAAPSSFAARPSSRAGAAPSSFAAVPSSRAGAAPSSFAARPSSRAAAAAAGCRFAVTRAPELPGGSSLTGIAASGEAMAWAVGHVPATPTSLNRRPIVERWDGQRWQLVTLPALPPVPAGPVVDAVLTSVSVARDGEVWAAGMQRAETSANLPLILHGAGAGWSAVPLPAGLSRSASYAVWSVAADGYGHVWLAGSVSYHDTRMLLMSWDGSRWTTHHLSTGAPTGALSSVVAIDGRDAWATGVATYHWNGTAWARVPVPAGLGQGDALAATDGRDVWLSGSSGGAATIERWGGTAWAAGPDLPAPLAVRQLGVDTRHRAWAAGTGTSASGRPIGTVLRWDGRSWSRVALPPVVTGSDTVGIGVAVSRGGRTAWAFADVMSPVAGSARNGPVLLRATC
ncbi:MAG: hypothetical protein AUI14_01175 [Actinobacteria bacterium 13_2_20CM_2_71_6]|nr:MAG: hypothetical protein AUI14_01175 [Actinobacteria bacterium 13_2_20CM_2_71_6]